MDDELKSKKISNNPGWVDTTADKKSKMATFNIVS